MAIVQQGQFQDPRPLINRLRRVDLWKLCDYYSIQYDNSVEQPDSLIRKILSAGINFQQYVKINGFGWPYIDLQVRQLPKEEKALEAIKKKEKFTEIQKEMKPKKVFASFEKMKEFELRSLCKQRGIKFTNTEKKFSLIDKLNSSPVQKIG